MIKIVQNLCDGNVEIIDKFFKLNADKVFLNNDSMLFLQVITLKFITKVMVLF